MNCLLVEVAVFNILTVRKTKAFHWLYVQIIFKKCFYINNMQV